MFKNRKLIAVQADALDSLKLNTDSSLYLAEEFARIGFKVFFYTVDQLSYYKGELIAYGAYITFEDYGSSIFKISEYKQLNLAEADVVMIRQNPPFDSLYLTNTYLLENLPSSCLVINSPTAIRNFSEKLSIFELSHLIPATIVSQNYEVLEKFFNEYQNVVIKPIYSFGGSDVKLIDSVKKFKELIPSYLSEFQTCILQEYFPQIKVKGDKRVLIAGGKIVGVINRIPQGGSILSNMASGGIATAGELNEKDQLITDEITKFLIRKNIFLAGVDILDGRLIEINVTSPTGFKAYNNFTKINLAKQIVDMILNYRLK